MYRMKMFWIGERRGISTQESCQVGLYIRSAELNLRRETLKCGFVLGLDISIFEKMRCIVSASWLISGSSGVSRIIHACIRARKSTLGRMPSYEYQVHNACGVREGGGFVFTPSRPWQHSRGPWAQRSMPPSAFRGSSPLMSRIHDDRIPPSLLTLDHVIWWESDQPERGIWVRQGIPRIERTWQGVLTFLLSHIPPRTFADQQSGGVIRYLLSSYQTLTLIINNHISNNLQTLDYHQH